jgi:hypothetical protein
MNSTPVSVTVRQAIRHGRIENPPSNDRPKPSGSSTVFAICMRAPALVTLRTTQSMTVDVPRTILAPLSTRERLDLRRSCIVSLVQQFRGIARNCQKNTEVALSLIDAIEATKKALF